MRIFLVFATLLVVQSILSLREGYRFLAHARRSWRKPLPDFAPRAAVIIPCKGIEPDLESNLSAFLAQHYPRYQVILVVASQQDPAHAAIASWLGRRDAARENPAVTAALVVAGYSEVRGEKVNNLIQGVAAADGKTEALVFADIDARPRRDWLRSLVAPLGDSSVTVSTGFRWYLPGSGFASRLRAAWDTSIATLLREGDYNFAWGGSMAIRAHDFERLRVVERYWARAVSDDYALTRAVREAGGRIRFEPRCLVASREESSFREFLRWSTRQIIITRVYAPRLWLLGLASHALYCSTFVLALISLAIAGPATRVRLVVAAFLVGILWLGIAKARLRTVVARDRFPDDGQNRYASYWQFAPLVPWIMFLNFVIAGVTRRIEWRGTQYELLNFEQTRVLRRRF